MRASRSATLSLFALCGIDHARQVLVAACCVRASRHATMTRSPAETARPRALISAASMGPRRFVAALMESPPGRTSAVSPARSVRQTGQQPAGGGVELREVAVGTGHEDGSFERREDALSDVGCRSAEGQRLFRLSLGEHAG